MDPAAMRPHRYWFRQPSQERAMTETADTKQAFNEFFMRKREAHARRRGYLIGAGVATAIGALLLLMMVLIWPWVDRTVYLRDDRGLGENFRTHTHPNRSTCQSTAEALYNHGLFVLDGRTYDTEGWAPRSEKAFYAGCTGSDWIPGGD
jgi:hypothetical protein